MNVAPMSIKAMPVEARELAVRHSRMAGKTMGEWLAAAIELKAAQEAGNALLPLEKPGRTLVPAGTDIDVAAWAAALQALAAAAGASGQQGRRS